MFNFECIHLVASSTDMSRVEKAVRFKPVLITFLGCVSPNMGLLFLLLLRVPFFFVFGSFIFSPVVHLRGYCLFNLFITNCFLLRLIGFQYLQDPYQGSLILSFRNIERFRGCCVAHYILKG